MNLEFLLQEGSKDHALVGSFGGLSNVVEVKNESLKEAYRTMLWEQSEFTGEFSTFDISSKIMNFCILPVLHVHCILQHLTSLSLYLVTPDASTWPFLDITSWQMDS